MARCFEGRLGAHLPEGTSERAWYSFACGTGSEMMLLGFDTLDACRAAFYCSVTNPVGVQHSEAPIAQADPSGSCVNKTLPAFMPFLPAGMPTSDPYLTVVAGSPPCFLLPDVGYAVYMGCVKHAEDTNFVSPYLLPNGPSRAVTTKKFDPRGEGRMHLEWRHNAGVISAILLGIIWFCVLVCFTIFGFLRSRKRQGHNAVPVIAAVKPGTFPGDV